jgi:hypothetical protein
LNQDLQQQESFHNLQDHLEASKASASFGSAENRNRLGAVAGNMSNSREISDLTKLILVFSIVIFALSSICVLEFLPWISGSCKNSREESQTLSSNAMIVKEALNYSSASK